MGIPWAVFSPLKSIIVFRLEEEARIALNNFVECLEFQTEFGARWRERWTSGGWSESSLIP